MKLLLVNGETINIDPRLINRFYTNPPNWKCTTIEYVNIDSINKDVTIVCDIFLSYKYFKKKYIKEMTILSFNKIRNRPKGLLRRCFELS